MEKGFLFLGLVQVVIECVTFSVKLKYSIEVYFLFELLLVREIQKLNGYPYKRPYSMTCHW